MTAFLLVGDISSGQSQIAGHYVSNFAVSGWFRTQILLNSDFTFKYRFAGDLSFDFAQGTYTVDNDTVKLVYSEVSEDSISLAPIAPNTVSSSRPRKLLYKDKKLWVISDSGKVVKKRQSVSKMKRFIFFGKKRMKKRTYYLELVNYEWKNS